MNTTEARRQYQAALNAIDLAHCLRLGSANEITFQAWWDQFASGKEFEAARKQWLRWKTDFKAHGIPCEFVDDGREKHVIVTRQTVEVAEQLRTAAEAALEAEAEKEPPRRYPDTVTIKGKRYRLKVYGRDVRPLNDREYAELKASVQAKGRIEVAILVDHAGDVVDGKHRLIVAEELGLEDVPIVTLAETDREALHDLAVQLNACRRQLTKQELAELRRQRQERALEKRAAGMSTRQIAAEEGVAPTTIHKDLEDAGGVDGEVVGKDGRRHRGKQPSEAEQAARREKIAALRAENPGVTVRQIANALGLSPSTVERELQALDAEDASGGEQPPGDDLVAVPPDAVRCFGIDPEQDDLRTCLDALLRGLEQIAEKARETEVEQLVAEARLLVDTLILRLLDEESE